jgi:EmrB/QacA subfamily drug resistance transporter
MSGLAAGREGALDPKVWRVAGVVLLAPIMTNLDATIVNVALSTIRADLHASIETVQWTVSGYLLALALMLPMNGWLVDRLGARRVYLACVSAFTLASLLCGAARTMEQLIVFRVLQGIAGGLLTPMTQLMLARVAGKQLARVMGYTSIPVLVVPALGPVVAGALLRVAPWPWLFYLNVPVGGIALGLAWFFLPGDAETIQKRPFDLAGFLVLSPGLVCLLYGLEAGTKGGGAATVAAGAALIAVFLWRARQRGSAALIDLELFRNRTFTAAVLMMFWFNGMIFAGNFLLPLFLITGCGLTPQMTGWLLAPYGVGMMCVFPFMGFLVERFGNRAVAATGAALGLVGTLPLLWVAEESAGNVSLVVVAACMFVRGIGQGGIAIPSVSAAYSSVPKGRLPIATTAVNIVQRLGGPFATTVVAIVMARDAGVTGPRAFTFALVALVVLHAIALGSSSRLPASLPARS